MTPIPRPAEQVLDEEFLVIRAKVLELAAALDRLDRGAGDVSSDERRARVRQGIEILLAGDRDRAERVQLLFSREYQSDWRARLGVVERSEG